MPKVTNQQNLVSSILFIAVGSIGLWLGRNYPLGSASAMGPGYLPRLLSAGIIAVGV